MLKLPVAPRTKIVTRRRIIAGVCCSSLFAAFISAAPIALPRPYRASKVAQKSKLPKPRVLERDVRLDRDPATGELRTRGRSAAGENPELAPVIRAHVALVEVGCTVTAPDGSAVPHLTQSDFRLLENGKEQNIAAFDAATTPASIALVLDASPSIYRELTGMRDAAQSLARSLAPDDEVAVIAFAYETVLLLPFSRDRSLLGAALNSPDLRRVANSSQSFIYQSVYLAARELFPGRTGRKAIVLLTDGQDSGVGLTSNAASMEPNPAAINSLSFADVARALAAQGIELYVISTQSRPRAMTPGWLSARRDTSLVTPEARRLGIPQYTLYLAELVRQVGGELYFLRELGGLAEVYRRIALTLRSEYTLGYYPVEGAARPGWRSLRVELRLESEAAGRAAQGAEITHRTAYYVPAAP